MAIQKVYVGSVGPFLYDDANPIGDPDGDFAGEDTHALATEHQVFVGTAPGLPEEVVRLADMTAVILPPLSVADIDNPAAELGAVGGVAGTVVLAYEVEANADQLTLYAWDNACGAGVDVPYVVVGSSGFWIAVAGKYIAAGSTIRGDLTLTAFSSGAVSVGHILDDVINRGVLDDITVSADAGIGNAGLNISWTAGEVWDYANSAIVVTNSANAQACTDDAINYLYWNAGANLTLSTTPPSGNQVRVGVIYVQDTVIWDIEHAHILNEREAETARALGRMFPSIVTSGLVVSEHAGANAFDIDMTQGVYYLRGHEEHAVGAFDSTVTDLVRWFHDGGGNWDYDLNSQIDPTQYDTGTGLAAVDANKYYRSTFFVVGTKVQWIYPTTGHNTIAQALAAGACPPKPNGLEHFPRSVCVVLRGNDAAFPAPGSERWIDSQPRPGMSAGGAVTSHTELADVTANDHHNESHKDRHDPNDGADPLDTANAAEIADVQGAGTGISHSLARADHVHAISHAITDNHLVTVDGPGAGAPADGEYAKWTVNGLEGKTTAEVMGDLSGSAGAAFDFNAQNITGAGTITGTELNAVHIAGDYAKISHDGTSAVINSRGDDGRVTTVDFWKDTIAGQGDEGLGRLNLYGDTTNGTNQGVKSAYIVFSKWQVLQVGGDADAFFLDIDLSMGDNDIIKWGNGRDYSAGYRSADDSFVLMNDYTIGTDASIRLLLDPLGNFGFGGAITFGANAAKTFALANGTAPTADIANQHAYYSADIVAGNAAPHFRTENAEIIKLYQQAHIADAPGDTAANNAVTINAILVALENNGLLANA